MDLLATLAAVVAGLWTLLPLVRHDAWWIRGFEFPRVQVTVLTVVTLLAYLMVAGWRDTEDQLLIALLAACIVLQLIRIVRYTPLYPTQVKTAAAPPDPAATLSLLVANVLTPNRESAKLLQLIQERDPDVVLAVETDDWWQSRLDELEADYPYSIKHPLDNLYGMHLYSRLELVDPRTLFLVEDDVPSMHADVVLRSGHRVALHCVHPAPPSPTENPTAAERDAELLVIAKTLDAQARSVVVMGDLNDVAWSASTRLFQRLSGLLDPRIGRGMYSTFHAGYPFLRWPLDHVFCSPDFMLVSLARLGDIGSDHFPIQAVLCHSPAAEALHEDLKADQNDRTVAEDKITKVDVDDDAVRELASMSR